MAALFGDVKSLPDSYRRPSNDTSESASASPSASPPPSASSAPASSSTTPITSFQLLEGLDGKIQRYRGIAGIQRAVNALSEKLRLGETTDGATMGQYLVFRPVTVDEFDKIDNQRDKVGKGIRLTHCADIETLIIKVPTTDHEVVSQTFGDEVAEQAIGMGLPREERTKTGGAKYYGISTTKQADQGMKPSTLRPRRMDWPTLIFETGVSESLPKLRTDASWWLSNSGGQVNIVLIFHVNREARSILIEKWENAPATGRPSTRSTLRQAQIPTQMEAITIDQNSVTGAPLTLHFHKVFLRQANPPEHDMVFTAQDLRVWANSAWAGLN